VFNCFPISASPALEHIASIGIEKETKKTNNHLKAW